MKVLLIISTFAYNRVLFFILSDTKGNCRQFSEIYSRGPSILIEMPIESENEKEDKNDVSRAAVVDCLKRR